MSKKLFRNNYERYKLLEKKKIDYSKEQLDIVLKLIEENKHPQEIAIESNMTARQIKIVRFIKENGTPDDIRLLYECKYYISRIKAQINYRKKKQKATEKFVSLDYLKSSKI